MYDLMYLELCDAVMLKLILQHPVVASGGRDEQVPVEPAGGGGQRGVVGGQRRRRVGAVRPVPLPEQAEEERGAATHIVQTRLDHQV